MSTVAHAAARGDRTIRLALAEVDYERFLADGEFAKEQLDGLYGQHPELFPAGGTKGMCTMGLRKHHASKAERTGPGLDLCLFMAQLPGLGVIFLWVFAASLVVWFIVNMIMGIRVSEEDELRGVDAGERGLEAYPEFVGPANSGK